MTRVVITGAAGIVGSILLRDLSPSYDVVGVDRRRPSQGAGRRVLRGDVRRRRVARRALEGAEVVVHLAAVSSYDAGWRTVQRVNVPLTSRVLEAAVEAGARRVVLASSNHVVGGYEQEPPFRDVLAGSLDGLDPASLPRLGPDAPVRPDGPYAVGKVFDEAAGRHVSDQGDLSVIALRIGTVRPDDVPTSTRHLATFLTHRDLVHLVERCIDAPAGLGFGVVYGVSANTWRIWDIEPARRLLGYEPRDDAEVHRPSVAAD